MNDCRVGRDDAEQLRESFVYCSDVIERLADAQLNTSHLRQTARCAAAKFSSHLVLWYAEQPWPGLLVVKQLGLEWLSSLIVGLTIGVVGRKPQNATGSLVHAMSASA